MSVFERLITMDNNYNCFYSISHDENAMVTLLAWKKSKWSMLLRIMILFTIKRTIIREYLFKKILTKANQPSLITNTFLQHSCTSMGSEIKIDQIVSN